MASEPPSMQDTIGRYRITGKLGEGGMGVVFAAHDDQLDRPVAVKMIRELGSGARERERFLREARAAAGVNHPGVCQLFEIGEHEGEPFIAMELLDGQSLAARLHSGALPSTQAIDVMLATLGVLQALHQRGFVHRDLKPTNLFLTPHGVKLLDFGLARPVRTDVDVTNASLTSPGAIVGTPQYMAPESLRGERADARADLFSAGVLLFEMLTGKPPFKGGSVVEVAHAVLHENAPVLTGSKVVVALDRVIHRALAKRPDDRYESAEKMAHDLRQVAQLPSDSGEVTPTRELTRLIVLPFRVLRPDAEIDFLAYSLSDAITASLSGLGSLVVRSSLVASRFSTDAPDLEAIARQAEVDVVLVGTLLRAGERLRVAAQLVEAPSGTVVWSDTSQVSLGDIFQLQDDLARRIVDSLALPLTAREHSLLKHDLPASPKAYEDYLRANQIAADSRRWPEARDLYQRCLEQDPRYAPAWARLARIYRVLGKYYSNPQEATENLQLAQDAFERALEINPDLPIAHNLYTFLEVDSGRAKEAMQRLLERAWNAGADPELFAGLVQASRYCGLMDASLAAHDRARRLDPKVPTSVGYTYWWLRDYPRVLTRDVDDPFLKYLAMIQLDRADEAVSLMKGYEDAPYHTRHFMTSARALAEGDVDESVAAVDAILDSGFRDPEGLYLITRQFASMAQRFGLPGAKERAVDLFGRTVASGFFCYPAMKDDPLMDVVRTDATFKQHLAAAERRHLDALSAFREGGGDTVLGLSTS